MKGLSSSKGTTKHPIKLSGKALPSSGEIRIELKDGQKTVFNYETKVIVKEPLLFEPVCFASKQQFQCLIDVRSLASCLRYLQERLYANLKLKIGMGLFMEKTQCF